MTTKDMIEVMQAYESDMCAGSEIEFRRLDDNGFVDADSTILIEDIIKKTK